MKDKKTKTATGKFTDEWIASNWWSAYYNMMIITAIISGISVIKEVQKSQVQAKQAEEQALYFRNLFDN